MAGNTSLQEILTYGYCSLQYRYRYVLGLPWFPASGEAASSVVIREASRQWFRAFVYPTTHKVATPMAMEVLDSGLSAVQQTFGRAFTNARNLAVEFCTATIDFDRYFKRDRDVVLGFDIPAELSVLSDVTIEGRIDFAYRRMPDTPQQTTVIVTVSSTEDPLENLPNYLPVREGFAFSAVRRTLKDTSDVQFQTMPIMRRRKPVRLPVVTYDTIADYTVLVRQVVRGIQNQIAIPAATKDKCWHCPYKRICKARHATATKADVEEERAVLESEASKSAIAQWRPPHA